MPPYDVFFFGALFFLTGILLASLGFKSLILLITFLLAAIFLAWWFFRKNKRLFWLAGLTLFILLGALYYVYDDIAFRNIVLPFGEKLSVQGVVIRNPVVKNNSQDIVVKLAPPITGNVIVKLPRYPEFQYGDELLVTGAIKKPEPEGYAKYLAKERISGAMRFPKVKLLAKHKGSAIKAHLFNFKNRIVESFQKVLPKQEAAFLSGLTLGGRSEFSKEFQNAMSLSGTTHLVALSGYNIMLIVIGAMWVFTYFFSRRISFLLTIIVIIGFVIMTGAEASVVRAAIIGFLLLLAKDIGRLYDFRNPIILAGLLMVLWNPKVLAFDVGFQLSFLALLGIIYLQPAIQKFFRIIEEPGFLAWRDHLLATTSAQLAVVPILISNFGNFSLTSIIANVLILETVPVAMILGFLLAAAQIISYYVALVFGWIVWPLLAFEILIIELFAKLSVPVSASLSWGFISVYYLFLIGFIAYVRHYIPKT